MFLKKISLYNYKNFSELSLEFDSKINCFVGKNGVGKTNILDSIFHLANGKSYFNPISVQNIKHNEDFFVLDGMFEINDRVEQISTSYKKNQKKILKRNGKIYEKFSDHIGLIPLVIISPYDNDLILEGSDIRRRFIDSVISQIDAGYLQNIIQYQKVVSQRNALLKYFALNNTFDNDTLSIYNEQLQELGNPIFEKRKKFIENFEPIFKKYYIEISGSTENISLVYESQLFSNTIIELLASNINKDRILQYTSSGIHKDDLLFQIDGFPIKKFGSQGQQKTYLIALKLAQFDFLKKQCGEKPILLFDDIFDKLDESRVSKIVEMVNKDEFGQLFISDTHADRTENIVKNTLKSYKIFNL